MLRQAGRLGRRLGAAASAAPGQTASMSTAVAALATASVARRVALGVPALGLGTFAAVADEPTKVAYQAAMVPVRLGRDVACATAMLADYLWTLRGLEGEAREEAKRGCHQRGADHLLRVCFANGGIYIKLGQHIGMLVGGVGVVGRAAGGRAAPGPGACGKSCNLCCAAAAACSARLPAWCRRRGAPAPAPAGPPAARRVCGYHAGQHAGPLPRIHLRTGTPGVCSGPEDGQPEQPTLVGATSRAGTTCLEPPPPRRPRPPPCRCGRQWWRTLVRRPRRCLPSLGATPSPAPAWRRCTRRLTTTAAASPSRCAGAAVWPWCCRGRLPCALPGCPCLPWRPARIRTAGEPTPHHLRPPTRPPLPQVQHRGLRENSAVDLATIDFLVKAAKVGGPCARRRGRAVGCPSWLLCYPLAHAPPRLQFCPAAATPLTLCTLYCSFLPPTLTISGWWTSPRRTCPRVGGGVGAGGSPVAQRDCPPRSACPPTRLPLPAPPLLAHTRAGLQARGRQLGALRRQPEHARQPARARPRGGAGGRPAAHQPPRADHGVCGWCVCGRGC